MNDEAARALTEATDEQPVEQPDQPVEQPVEHEPSEITYVESFYPARPRQLRPRARLRSEGMPLHGEDLSGEPVGTNDVYVRWLLRESMLQDAKLMQQPKDAVGCWFFECQPDLVQDTDRRDVLEHARRNSLDDQRSCQRLDLEAEPGGETGCANDAGWVVDERAVVQDADRSGSQVFEAVA